MENTNLKTLLEKAFENEKESYNFYLKLSGAAKDKKTKNILLYIAEQEKVHMEFLTGYMDGIYTMNSLKMNEMIDPGIGRHLDDYYAEADMQDKDEYPAAIRRESDLYYFYSKLAEIQPYGIVKKTLLRMAEEEQYHKKTAEQLYKKDGA